MLNTALSRSILTIEDQFVKGFQKQIMFICVDWIYCIGGQQKLIRSIKYKQ